MSDVQRERVLSEIARSFVTKAASYGFSVAEIIEYLHEFSRNGSYQTQ